MGGTASAIPAIDAVIRGAAGDRLVLIDATGPVVDVEIGSDDWSVTLPLPGAHTFIRAEIIAAASRPRMIDEFTSALDGRDLPWQLKGADLAQQPIRRALSNPIYVEA